MSQIEFHKHVYPAFASNARSAGVSQLSSEYNVDDFSTISYIVDLTAVSGSPSSYSLATKIQYSPDTTGTRWYDLPNTALTLSSVTTNNIVNVPLLTGRRVRVAYTLSFVGGTSPQATFSIDVAYGNTPPSSTITNTGTAVSIVDGADVAKGSTVDAAVVGDASGSLSAKLRGLSKIWNDIWDSVNHRVKVDGSGVTQPMSAASLPLPTGAATSANQTTGNTSLSSIDTKTPALGQALAASSVPVVLTAAQITTLTPPTTVTSNVGTTNGLALDSTLIGGTTKAITRGGAKGSTAAADVTSISVDANTQALHTNVTNFPATQPVSIADGSNITQGNTTDASYSGSGAGSMVSLLKGIYAKPASGADTTSSGALGALNAAVTVATAGEASVGVNILAGTLAGTLLAEYSKDGGTTWFSSVFVNVFSATINTSLVLTNPNAAQAWAIITDGGTTHVRVRVSAYTSGTATAQVSATAGGKQSIMVLGWNGTTMGLIQLDASNFLKTREQYAPGYEDNTNNKAVVEHRYSYATITTATTTTIKSGAGLIHSISILGGTLGAITAYDNTTGSGTTICPTFTPTASVPCPPILLDESYSTGLTIVTASATIINVAYR